MAWLVTGGAGYIGAHVVRALLASGREVVVLDDLSTGRAARVPAEVTLIRGEVRSRRSVRRALHEATEAPVTGVIHLATRSGAATSVTEPLAYWSQNVGGLQVLLEELVEAGIGQVILGSSAAVYGRSLMSEGRAKVVEPTAALPVTPLGATQLAAEQMLDATAHAHGWKALSLRLFTVAGAAAPELGTTSTEGLIPRVMAVHGEGGRPQIYGEDFPTPDGSLVRDFIHVSDVAAAFLAAARIVETAYLAATTTAEAAQAVRAASERMHTAAVRAEQEARKLPGASLAAGMASGVPAAARALERLPGASRAMGLAAESLDGALGAAAAENLREQVTGVATQLGSLVAKVAGVDDAPRLRDHLVVNIGTGRGHSAFDVVEALRASTGEPFAVDIAPRRGGDPAYVVASADLAAALLGWRARLGLRAITDSAWAAWQHDHPHEPDPS